MPGFYGNTQLVNVRGLDVPDSHYYCNVRALCEALVSGDNGLFAISYNIAPTNLPSGEYDADQWASLGSYARNFYIDKEIWGGEHPIYTPSPPFLQPPHYDSCTLSKEWTVNGYNGTIWLAQYQPNHNLFLQLVATADLVAPEVILLPHSPQYADDNSLPKINTTYSSPGLLYLEVSPNWKWKTDVEFPTTYLSKYIPDELPNWTNPEDTPASNMQIVKSKTETHLDTGNDTLQLKVSLPALDQVYGLLCNILFGTGNSRNTTVDTYLSGANQLGLLALMENINSLMTRSNDETESIDFDLSTYSSTRHGNCYSYCLNDILTTDLPSINENVNNIHHLSLTFPDQETTDDWYNYVVCHKIELRFDENGEWYNSDDMAVPGVWYLDLYLNPGDGDMIPSSFIDGDKRPKLTLTAVF